MKSRAKDIMPNVLLTLLSIIQALALELLWSHLQTADYLFQGDWTRLIFGMQVLGTFMGILVSGSSTQPTSCVFAGCPESVTLSCRFS